MSLAGGQKTLAAVGLAGFIAGASFDAGVETLSGDRVITYKASTAAVHAVEIRSTEAGGARRISMAVYGRVEDGEKKIHQLGEVKCVLTPVVQDLLGSRLDQLKGCVSIDAGALPPGLELPVDPDSTDMPAGYEPPSTGPLEGGVEIHGVDLSRHVGEDGTLGTKVETTVYGHLHRAGGGTRQLPGVGCGPAPEELKAIFAAEALACLKTANGLE